MSWRTEWRDSQKEFDPESFKEAYNKLYCEEFAYHVTEKNFTNIIMNREKRIIDELKKFEWDSLLDIGCQNGRQLVQIRPIFPDKKLTGLDISSDALEDAKRIIPSANFVECAAEKMPFADSQFDVAYISETLEHVIDVDAVLKEVRRVIRPNGIMIGTVPIGNYHDGGMHLRYYDCDGLFDQLSNHFIVEELERISALYSSDEETVFYFKCRKIAK